MRITESDLEGLSRSADRLASEAQTWREGFAVKFRGQWTWTDEYQEIQCRVMKLETSERFLRTLAAKLEKMKTAEPTTPTPTP